MNNAVNGLPKYTNDGRVNFQFVKDAVSRLTFVTTCVEGSTVTIVSAFFEGFHIADGTSACVNPLNYNPEIGKDVATKAAIAKAEDKLWELFGWDLHNYLKETGQLYDPAQVIKKSEHSYPPHYTALLELDENLATYNGQSITQSRHDANLTRLKDSGKKFKGHTIYHMDNGGPHYIILSTSDAAGQSYLYIAVTEPMLYQIQELCIYNTTK